jgi:hypothetical protein
MRSESRKKNNVEALKGWNYLMKLKAIHFEYLLKQNSIPLSIILSMFALHTTSIVYHHHYHYRKKINIYIIKNEKNEMIKKESEWDEQIEGKKISTK